MGKWKLTSGRDRPLWWLSAWASLPSGPAARSRPAFGRASASSWPPAGWPAPAEAAASDQNPASTFLGIFGIAEASLRFQDSGSPASRRFGWLQKRVGSSLNHSKNEVPWGFERKFWQLNHRASICRGTIIAPGLTSASFAKWQLSYSKVQIMLCTSEWRQSLVIHKIEFSVKFHPHRYLLCWM